MDTKWVIRDAGTVLDVTIAREAVPIGHAIDAGQRADIRAAFNGSDRALEPLVERSAAWMRSPVRA